MTADAAPQTPAFIRPSAVAERYAGALFALARDAGALATAEADMKSVAASITASGDLRAFLRSPVYSRDEKGDAIAAIAASAGYSHLTRNILGLLAQKGRLFALEEIAAAFLAMAARERGEVSAEAVSAAPLSDDQRRRLRSEIESVVGRAVNLSTKVDPDLLGGLVVKVGSTMIDSSLRTKLNKLKSAMKEA